jgi:hypothetical protein
VERPLEPFHSGRESIVIKVLSALSLIFLMRSPNESWPVGAILAVVRSP